jgi:hypothetical protein
MSDGRVFQQRVGIDMGKNWYLLTNLFLYCMWQISYKLVRSFNLMFRYIDGVLSLNNSKLEGIVDRIYSIEQNIKYITDTARSASLCGLRIEIDSDGW